MKTAAIIPAGGIGKRMKRRLSKQYLSLGGEPILAHTLKVFESASVIQEIFLVVPEGDIEEVRQRIVSDGGFTKVRAVLAGGQQRQDSVRNGLDAVDADTDVVVIHDAVRPFVSAALIRLAVEGAFETGAVTVGVPVKDTVKRVREDGQVLETLNRRGLWLTQTPQAFKWSLLVEAYRQAEKEHFYGTDDASLVERIGIPVKMITASDDNLKITTPEDFLLAEVLLKRRQISYRRRK